MRFDTTALKELIRDYDAVVKVIDKDARNQNERAYGGMVRDVKGKLQEHITEELVKIAWKSIGGEAKRLEINSKKIEVPIQKEYVDAIGDSEIRQYIFENIENYVYKTSVDKHIFIDNKFVIGIECKSYTENAMMKRILVDFHLLKIVYPDLKCWLFQLESQLGGDYSSLQQRCFGSRPTHTLMSFFKDVDLTIFTLLEGERKVDKPIHIHGYFKPLKYPILLDTAKHVADEFKKFK